MSTHATTTRASAMLLGRNSVLALTLTFAVSGLASAQTATRPWQGAIFQPSTGEWIMESTPAGGLSLFPTNPSAPSTVEILLPPGTPGAMQSVELEIDPFDPATSAAIQPGAGFEYTAYGEVGGVSGQPMGTLRGVKHPGGGVEYAYDFSALGVTTVTVEFFDGPTQLAIYTAVPVGPIGTGGGPLFTPNCTCPTCPAHWYCCWLGLVTYSNGVWYNAWNCPIPIDWYGNTHNANRIAVTPENPVLPLGELESCSLSSIGIPRIELSDLTLDGFTPIGANYCNATPNSTGLPGVIYGLGSGVAAHNDLNLYAFQLPHDAFGYFIVSPFQAFVPNAGSAQGNLCVGLSTGRFRSQLGNTGSNGYLVVDVDLTDLPQPNGSVVVQAGQTWNFQCWHRDANPNVTSNFTTGYSITFQ
jgi:hypothetical protein